MNHFKAIRKQNIIMKCNINRLLFPMGLWPILPTTKRLGFKIFLSIKGQSESLDGLIIGIKPIKQ